MSLARLLEQATPPLRIAGIPPGVISASDWDVTDDVLATWPDMARLLIDMAADLKRLDEWDHMATAHDGRYWREDVIAPLLARFADLAAGETDGAGSTDAAAVSSSAASNIDALRRCLKNPTLIYSTKAEEKLDALAAQVAALTQERDEAVEAYEGQADFGAKQIARAEAAEAAIADTRRALEEARDWIADDIMPGNDWQARLLNRIDGALAATGGYVPAGEAAAATAPTTEGARTPVSESSAPAGQEQQP